MAIILSLILMLIMAAAVMLGRNSLAQTPHDPDQLVRGDEAHGRAGPVERPGH